MVTFASQRQATRSGTQRGSVVIEGVDALVQDFTREAATVRQRAERTVVDFAERAAQIQRDLVPIDEGDVLDSITADSRATQQGDGVFADAGPDPRANDQAFVARFLEGGTVKMPPRQFVNPSADRILPEFQQAIRDLSNL